MVVNAIAEVIFKVAQGGSLRDSGIDIDTISAIVPIARDAILFERDANGLKNTSTETTKNIEVKNNQIDLGDISTKGVTGFVFLDGDGNATCGRPIKINASEQSLYCKDVDNVYWWASGSKIKFSKLNETIKSVDVIYYNGSSGDDDIDGNIAFLIIMRVIQLIINGNKALKDSTQNGNILKDAEIAQIRNAIQSPNNLNVI